MFKFNFDNEESEKSGSESVNRKEKNEIDWYKSKKISVPSNIKNTINDISEEQFNEIKIGINKFFCVSPKEVMSTLKKGLDSQKFLDVIQADDQHSDLLPGKYEGGLKIWECTNDLALYLTKNVFDKFQNKMEGINVLDLGCGSGLLGILFAQKGANVTFQDYNEEVLEFLTIPNVFMNCNNLKSKVEFYSGDWSSFLNLILNSNNKNENSLEKTEKFNYILTSETIYNQDNYNKLISIFKKLIKDNGIIYVASKTHYFGVGGNLLDFMMELDKNDFDSKIVWETSEGVLRKIVEVRKQKQFS